MQIIIYINDCMSAITCGRKLTYVHILQLNVIVLCFCRHTFATLSFLAETFLFLYVGMDALDIEKWKFVGDRYHFFSFSF